MSLSENSPKKNSCKFILVSPTAGIKRKIYKQGNRLDIHSKHCIIRLYEVIHVRELLRSARVTKSFKGKLS